jgi:NADH:ubiquinone oxidoreductase subunit 6 (subunit J)
MEVIVVVVAVVICTIVLLAAWRTGKGNLTKQDKTALKTGLLFATVWFGGLAVVVWASLQTQGITGKLIATFGFIGFAAGLFKFAEWYNKKQKQN